MMPIIQPLIAAALASVIIGRCVYVLHRAHWRSHVHGYLHFSGFGYSYVALATAAFLAAMHSLNDRLGLVEWLFLAGSAGLIFFRRKHADPNTDSPTTRSKP